MTDSKEAVTVIVSLKSGVEIMGVLRERTDEIMVLAAARIEGVDGNGKTQWQPLAGEVVVPLANVDYWQRGIPAAMLAQLK